MMECVVVIMQDRDVLNAPLPVFHLPSSAEYDATIMRPPAHGNSCLRIQQATEYLVPVPGPSAAEVPSSPSTSSVQKLLGASTTSDQETNCVLPESKSTQPLLEEASCSSTNSNSSTGKQNTRALGDLFWSPSILVY